MHCLLVIILGLTALAASHKPVLKNENHISKPGRVSPSPPKINGRYKPEAGHSRLRIKKRGSIGDSCNREEKESIKEAMDRYSNEFPARVQVWTIYINKPCFFSSCKTMADKAYYAADKNGSLFHRFFKTNDPDDAVAVRRVFYDVEKACDRKERDSFVFECDKSEGGSCTPDSTHAYVHDKQEMYICPYFFEHDLTERASTLIHELTHHKDSECSC